ncbi:YheT family hydrolase [Galbibacter sp.]|uniref:YheT family hydrolase n=1 Tax=Galbibacter sp. TaxID=2918471 RepID=UPI003A940BD2
MPLFENKYRPPLLFRNGHFSTVFASGLRRITNLKQYRTQLPTPDGDILDLDWSDAPTKTDKLAIIIHGLEGGSIRPYMKGSARAFNQNNIDVVCLNLRGCGGHTNKLYTSYHSGRSDDLKTVVESIITKYRYQHIYLNGFSLGANIILKYLGEQDYPSQVKAAVAVSAPCDLYGTMLELHKPKNSIYAYRFKKTLIHKLKEKQKQFPDHIDLASIYSIKTLKDFDDVYTSKAHGFIDAEDYYRKSSSLQYLKDIKIPTLILNALNDSFLSPSCYPQGIAKNHPNLYLETPKYGGHVGFFRYGGTYYSEQRAIEFIQDLQ